MTARASGEAGSAPTPVPADMQWHAPYNPWLIAGIATLATFMEVLDTTIVVVALPHIAGNLGASQDNATWVVSSYLLCIAVILPLAPWISAVMGRKNYYLLSVLLFTLSSLMCGMASSLGLLVFFRVLQGLAGGGLQPSTQAILVDTFPPRLRGMSMAMFGIVTVSAPVIGPTLGGWITDNFSWRWIFFINVPVGIVSLVLASKFISDPPYMPRRRGPGRFRVDYIGVGLVVLGLGTMEFVLSAGERVGWSESSFIVIASIVAGLAIVAAIFWELRHKDPVVNLRLLRDRNLGPCVLLFMLFGFSFYGSMVLLPLFLQGTLGYTAMQSGMAVSPGGMVIIAMMPFVGWIVTRVDPRKMVAFGLIVLSYSLFLMSRFSLDTGFQNVLFTRILISFGVSFIFVPINTMAYTYISRETRNSAASLLGLGRNLGASVGIAVAASLLTRHGQIHQNELVEHLAPHDPAYAINLERMTQLFLERSGDAVYSLSQARSLFYGLLREQSRILAFQDAYQILALAILFVVPMVFLVKKPRSPGT